MPQTAITLVLNRVPLFSKTTVKRRGETVPLKEEAKKAQSKVCFHTIDSLCGVKDKADAGSWGRS